MKFIKSTLLLLLAVFTVQEAAAQILAPTGTVSRASSQLIYHYDQDELDTILQVTNTNDTEGVWIHVKIFRSFSFDNKCDERNFVDFLTPNDTHVYDLDIDNFPKNIGETETTVGESTTIQDEDSLGFVIITPVVSSTDLSAISFQHIIGTAYNDSGEEYIINAMGRDAVDFTTGEILPDGTVLDGVTGGYVVLQPEELLFHIANDTGSSDSSAYNVVGIAFEDSYGPAGLLGYQALPANAVWTSFIFDFKESPTSCGSRPVDCFINIGVNDTLQQDNDALNPPGISSDDLCAGAVTPQYPGGSSAIQHQTFGWVRIFVSGLESSFVNHLGVYVQDDIEGSEYMHVRGARTEITPPPVEVCQFINGSPNCNDPLCAQEEVAEGLTCEEFNGDPAGFCGVDVPCEDPNCVGVEPNCPLPTPTPEPGTGGGGCSIAAGVTTATAAANFLLPLLPLAGAFAVRRMRRRNK